jgi:SNF2 family DNA or RNA helicase
MLMKMSDRNVHVSFGPSPGILSFTPAKGTSVRSVERALRIAGVPTRVEFGQRRVLASIGEIELVPSVFRGWGIEFAGNVIDGVNAYQNARHQHERAAELVRQLADADPNTLLTDFEERDKLDPHQVIAVAAATHPEVVGICIFDEQGLGKTVEALFAFHRLKQAGSIDRALIFAPKNMMLEWERDCYRFFGNLYRMKVISGTLAEKRAALNTAADLYVTNFETAIRLQFRLGELLKARGNTLLIVDESFFVKNIDAARTRALKTLRTEADRCIVLCGTPAPNSPRDIIEQFNIADQGITFEGMTLPDDDDAALKVIQETIERRGVYLRRLKREALPGLPGKSFTRVVVPMGPEQEAAYKAALKGLMADVKAADEEHFRAHYLSFAARRMALLQICSCPAAVLPNFTGSSAKLDALDEILNELISRRREKVVLWTFFRRSMEALVDRFQRFRPVRVDGSVNDPRDRREAVSRFQEDDETMLFLGNPAAAGAGVTLHRARYAIYESMSNQAAHYLQSLDRIHRRGQDRPVEYLVLVCSETIEEIEYDRLLEKERRAQDLLADRIEPPISRKAFLDDLAQAATLIGL